MSQIITILNVTKISLTQYSVEFSSNFALQDLFYEISTNGTTWSAPVAISNTASPQVITLQNVSNFQIRLSSNYIPPIPVETGFLMINSNDKFLINEVDSLKYTN